MTAKIIAADIKTCRKCGATFSTKECRPCATATMATWRAKNPGRAAEIAKKWRDTHPEKAKSVSVAQREKDGAREMARLRTAAWRESNPERAKAAVAAYVKANPEKIATMLFAYRIANKEKIKKKNADYYANNAERLRTESAAYYAANTAQAKATNAAYYLANIDKAKASRKAWRIANPEKKVIYSQNRRARKISNGGKLSQGLTEKLFRLQRGKCACCGKPLGKNYHLDHRMPLALGGTNSDENMQLLTAKCNMQKGAKSPEEFMQSRGFLI